MFLTLSLFKRLTACVLTATLATHASAALVSTDWIAQGDGLLVQDTASGLSWLNLSVTRAQSFEQVLSGGLLQSFRVATAGEVSGLLASSATDFQGQAVLTRLGAVQFSPEASANLGGDVSWQLSGVVASADMATTGQLVTVLSVLETLRDMSVDEPEAGDTASSGSIGETLCSTLGGCADTASGGGQVSLTVAGNTARYLRIKTSLQDRAVALPDAGVFLVAVPEPTTYALMGSGLLMLVWRVRRRIR